MTKLATIFKEGTKDELTKIKVITTGEPGIVNMTVKNTSKFTINNPRIDVPLGVEILEPKTFPLKLLRGASFSTKIKIDGVISFSEKLRFTYDFLKIEQS